MPSRVRSFVHETIDGDYTVFLNGKLSAEMQREAYEHELDHIKHHDFDSDQKADQIEKERN